ncbi:MAG: phosphoglycerate kinase [Candidatus Gribaldobacteria bacterium]|nr:phosphoglycerate kinase [Candidatus Gribaldobacteria bacterium]
MYQLEDFNFYNKRVLVRCDFNVAIKKGKVVDDFRIVRSLATLFYLKKRGAKIVLMSHLGRPEESEPTNKKSQSKTKGLSLRPIQKKLEELLRVKVGFSAKLKGRLLEGRINRMKAGEFLLLENLRFDQGEEANSDKLAKDLARLGDIFVNEAFSVCHRQHTSVYLLPQLMPHCAGFNLVEEVEFLSKVRDNPPRPFTVIIGGAKLDSKMKVIDEFIIQADHILFGGDIADVILAVKGICLGCSWPQQDIAEKIKKIDLTSSKIHLPIDVLMSPDRSGDNYIRCGAPGTLRKEEEILDLGSETVQKFSEIIRQSASVFWSGPLGLIENEKFTQGTLGVGGALNRNKGALKVLGGGDTVPILKKHGLADGFSFISSGGGAMLAFLAKESMPGLLALGYKV